MTNKVASTNRAISPVDRDSNFIVLLIFCLFTSGRQTISVLTEAALSGCGTSTVYLSGWWASVPDKSVISYDPMGAGINSPTGLTMPAMLAMGTRGEMGK